MKEILINFILTIFIIFTYFYYKKSFTATQKVKSKKNIQIKFSRIMIGAFFVFWVFTIIISLIHYTENIFMNIIFESAITALIIFIFYKESCITGKLFFPKKKIMLIFILVILLLFNISFMSNKSLYISKGEQISINEIEEGDILFLYSGSYDALIPGYWSHIGMVVKTSDHVIHVIEATTNGIKLIKLDDFIGDGRVSIAKVNDVDKEDIDEVIKFAKGKLGLSYNFNLINKNIDGKSYYCSELIWASYKQIDVDIDKTPGFSFKYFNGIAPQEIFGDDDVTIYNVNKYLKEEITDMQNPKK